MNAKSRILGAVAILAATSLPALAQQLPTDTVYRGPVQYPDFESKYKQYSFWKIKNPIIAAVSTGPDFAGHYTVAIASCGTDCSSVYIVDVATGQIYDFPYQGEKYRGKSIYYNAKSTFMKVTWLQDDYCLTDTLNFDPVGFKSKGSRVTSANKAHNPDLCE